MWGGVREPRARQDDKKTGRAPDSNKENISFKDQVIIYHCEKVVYYKNFYFHNQFILHKTCLCN